MSISEDRRRGGRLRFDIGSSVIEAPVGDHDLIGSSDIPVGNVDAIDTPNNRWVVITYVILGILLVAYMISLIVRNENQQWLWLDGWLLTSFELVASALCLYKGRQRRSGRAIPLILGLGLLCWTLGDFVLSFESLGGKTPPTPSGADALYLLFYPLAYIATVATKLAGWRRRRPRRCGALCDVCLP
jgi:peptidoglycan/LPS O-acetylase OafA/YrhL